MIALHLVDMLVHNLAQIVYLIKQAFDLDLQRQHTLVVALRVRHGNGWKIIMPAVWETAILD